MVQIDDIVPYMRRVQVDERELRELALLWQMIESSAAISCPHDVQTILPTLVQTRERFDELQRRVVHSLAAENLAQLQDELGATAQCAIDILVRNLFERTADVGFLATDDAIRDFCAAAPAAREALLAPLQQRLDQYRNKYSVYDDIIVLDRGGTILARLDTAAPAPMTADPIVAAALAAPGYVEQFGPSELGAGPAAALLYAHRIADARGAQVGVLVLRFRFEDEMQRIFQSVADEQHQPALVLLDAQDRVIASNDPMHIALGTRVRSVATGTVDLISFAGREYLATSCAAHAYQGYQGPQWKAHAMVSLLTAFRTRSASPGNEELTLDNEELRALQLEADAINRNLRRVVWNGRLMAGNGDAVRLKAVLSQVNQAGVRTSERVRLAVGDLHATSLDRACRQAAETARLAADIMDRNLYERANDCRWWALSPALRRALAAPAGPDSSAQISGVLEHINSLYTVYRRIVVFDLQGRIRGLSNERAERPLLGSTVAPELLQAIRTHTGDQQYAVSPYAASALSDDEPTYLYLAAIRNERGELIGGVALAFHAVREFTAMLADVIGERRGFAAFVDAQGAVLACNDPAHAPGSTLPFDTGNTLAVLGDEHFAVTRVRAGGYREFKNSDRYDNQVSAVVALRLGSSERRRPEKLITVASPALALDRASLIEVAIVQVGSARYALPAARVLSASLPARIVQAPNASRYCLGLMQVDANDTRTVIPVISARGLFSVPNFPRQTDGIAIVLRREEDARPVLGLWVDDVVSVLEIERSALQPTPMEVRSQAQLVTAVFDQHDSNHATLVQLLDVDRLEALAKGGAVPAVAAARAVEPVPATLAATGGSAPTMGRVPSLVR